MPTLANLVAQYDAAITFRKGNHCIWYNPLTWYRMCASLNPCNSRIIGELNRVLLLGNDFLAGGPIPGEAAKCYSILAGTNMQLAYLKYGNGTNNHTSVHDHFRQAKECYEKCFWWTEEQPYAETSLGILLSSPLNPEHNLEQALLYFQNAEGNGCQHAKYWHGRALLNGFGVERSTEKGFKLIQEAAGKQVRRALFETAALHEEGCEGVILKNQVLAIEYYDAVTMCENEQREWVWDYATAHLHSNREFHETENTIGTYVGSLFSWEFAGQAFLFGGVAALAATSNLKHYEVLLILLPIIGIVVAFLSVIMSFHTLCQNSRRRDKLLKVYKAKLKACETLVGPRVIPNRLRNLRFLARLAHIGEGVAVLLALTFLGGWSVLLAEVVPYDSLNNQNNTLSPS